MDIVFRPFRPEDRQAFLDMSDRFYHSPAVLHPIDPAFYARSFEAALQGRVFWGYMFEHAAQPCGYALVTESYSSESGGAVLWLEELYIEPAFRSRGAGRAFFSYLEQTREFTRFRLEVEPDNVRARQLYEKLGFSTLDYIQLYKERH